MPNVLCLPGGWAVHVSGKPRLLETLTRIDSNIVGVRGQYLHFVNSAEPLSDEDTNRIHALMHYGAPFEEQKERGNVATFMVVPRFGTVSPWASKATDIAHHCGLTQVRRIERGIEYTVILKSGLLGSGIGGKKSFNEQKPMAVPAPAADPITQSLGPAPDDPLGLLHALA